MNAVVEAEYVPADSAESPPPIQPPIARPQFVNALLEARTLSNGRRIRVAHASAHREPTIAPAENREQRRRSHLPKDGALVEVDAALEAWARWARAALSGLGWPTRTLLARVIEFGVSGAASQGAGATVDADNLCEIVERGVLRLGEIERGVICRHYLHWQPVEVSARYAHMSPGRFRTVLHRARRRIGDYLDGAKLALQQKAE